MEHAKSGENGSSGEDQPSSKKYKEDPGAPKHGKSVVVLLDSDVTVRDGLVFMPNTINMAELKKPDKGQYVGKINFTSEMTEEDVLGQLHLNLPIFKNKRIQRLSCASAVDSRTRLEFHGEQRLWSGALIKKHIRGNSALYLLAKLEENLESRRVSQESKALLVPTGTGAATKPLMAYTCTSVSGPSQQKQPLFVQGKQDNLLALSVNHQYSDTQISSRNTQQTLEQDMVARKRTAQWRGFPQQSVPPSGKQENGSYFVVQAVAGHGKRTTGQQPSTQVVQQERSPAAPTQNSSLNSSSATSQQMSLNQVPATIPVQHQADLRDKTAKWGSPSKQNLPTSVPQGTDLVFTQRLKELSQTCSTADQGKVTGMGDPLHAPPVQTPKQITTATEKLSVTLNQKNKKTHLHGQPENSAFELLMTMSDGETSEDSAMQSMLEDSTNSDHDTRAGQLGGIDPVIKLSPCKGSTKGGEPFYIILPDIVPLEITFCVADFKGCDKVLLQNVNPFNLCGRTPRSLQGPGLVKVELRSLDGSWSGGETKFLYEDLLTEEECYIQLVKDKKKWDKLFNWIDKGRNNPCDQQTSGPSDKSGQGTADVNQSRNTRSVKLLQDLVYKAAQIDGHEFIQMIFSTSAGKVVFNNYKNSATLPEDVARANGHTILADYLQDANNRLSKESDSDSTTESIDWLELKRAVDKEQSLPCTEDAQTLKNWQSPSCPDSDDNESDYFADDEISVCPSPSHSEVSDTEPNTEEVKDICPSTGSEEEIRAIKGSGLQEMTCFSDLSEAVKQQDSKDLKELQVKTRKVISKAKDTVASHRAAADKLDTVWKDCKIARASGIVGGIVGGCLTIAGGIATVMTAGAATPLLIAGMAAGAAGAGTTVVTSVVEAAINSSEIKKAEKDRQETLDCVKDVNKIVQVWLVEKEKRRLLYICYLAEQTLKSTDPAVIEILKHVVVPALTASATQMELAMLGALGWIAAQAVSTAVVTGGVKAGLEAGSRGVMSGLRQAGVQAAGKLMFVVCAAVVLWELIDLSYTIKDIVKNKGSDAAQYLRQKASELEKSAILISGRSE